jgi:hypothetical protein
VFESRVMLLGGAEMKTSHWIILSLSAWFLAAAALAADPPAAGSGRAERIRIQEERLPVIEQMAQQEREQVERRYTQRRARATREEAREFAAWFSLAERLRWIEYAHQYEDQPSTVDYFGSSYYLYPYTERAILLVDEMDREYTVSEMADLLRSASFREKLTQIVEEDWQFPVLRCEARRLLDVMDTLDVELTMDVRQLESNRTEQLNAIAQQEKDLQEQVRTILAYLKAQEQRPPQLGVVESVGYSPQSGYYCMIEGVDRVLQPGDTAQGVQVVSIDPEKVAFAKNGITWTQGLGAPAQPYWD